MQLKDCGRGEYTAIYEGNTEDDPGLLETLENKPPFPLALLRHITYAGQVVEGHDWQVFWGAFESAVISPGDSIRFIAAPRWYAKGDYWQSGLSQCCWVQRNSPGEIEKIPVFSPPTTIGEATDFLNSRLAVAKNKTKWDDPREWGVRLFRWDDSAFEAVSELIEAGWASFAPPEQSPEFMEILDRLEDSGLSSRTIGDIADIAAWCNAGSVAADYRVAGTPYRLCSAREFGL